MSKNFPDAAKTITLRQQAMRMRVLNNLAETMTASENLRVQNKLLHPALSYADRQSHPTRSVNVLGMAYAVTSLQVQNGKYRRAQLQQLAR